MSLKNSLVIITISFLSVSCGMSNKAILYFDDGKELTGFGKITTNNTVKFKKENTKVKKYNFKDLKRVTISSVYGINNYVKIKVKGQDSYKVLEEVVLGKVNLYKIVSEGHMVGAPMGGGVGGGVPMMTTHYYSISSYYVRKKDEIEATHLGSTSLFSKNFKKAASEYFADCNSLVSKIQNKEFKKRHIKEVVTYYNTNCK